ncbi:MAG: ABC transporter ATP-binding protein [Firmicutes bacterium]|uniref:ABC transporter ATP-binding protein n=1 Tax=Candidatus Gallilactobacillus intestinavium TaxID=2840838 RepID=A0A9D9E560_9LACO|nr:ABC transporter ATP-binding protein [Candidatus Gallilactobacillus intestinavium]
MSFIVANSLTKKYINGDNSVIALNDVNFILDKGSLNVILGPSGAGKTTLLNILGGIDCLTSGKLYVNSKDISNMTDSQLTEYRRNSIGFVFQFYNIIPSLTVLENVELVNKLVKDSFDPKEVINFVGLGDRMNHFPSDLSGGELQRVSIARAICKKPELLLCDEPTGALDSVTGKQILKLIKKMSNEQKITVVLVTHNSKIAKMGDNVLTIKDGQVDKLTHNTSPCPIDRIAW